ncbi:MAG: hypothetical protein CMO26_02190 [Thiotrichales bacterium]|nr:hypothetical protein [Thiotrichales bacterium]
MRAWFSALILQALALAIWWPKSNLAVVLSNERGPQPLLAVGVALGVTLAYFSLRAGAEEFLMDEQQSMREWALGTRLSVSRIILGSMLGHWAQLGLALLFSAPLVCIAYTISGGSLQTLGEVALALMMQSSFYWLLGAALYMGIGQYGQSTFVMLRAALIACYAVTAFVLPSASQLMLSLELFGAGLDDLMRLTSLPLATEFSLLYGFAALPIASLLALQLWWCRR